MKTVPGVSHPTHSATRVRGFISLLIFAACVCLNVDSLLAQNRPPNVILIVTDDQGFGEIAAHGNPVIKTPHLDKLHSESVRLQDFHVDPTCSPMHFIHAFCLSPYYKIGCGDGTDG
jgi:hypothetical protein